ncbi:MAG: Spy/CpxP family protein refolding chaperone [Myxococcota bacterium]
MKMRWCWGALAAATLMLGGVQAARSQAGEGAQQCLDPSEHLQKLYDEIQATPEQQAQIRQLFEPLFQDVRNLREKRLAAHDTLLDMWLMDNPDQGGAHVIAAELSGERAVIAQRMTKAFFQLRDILTPEQRQMLAESSRQRMREFACPGDTGGDDDSQP